MKLTVHHPDVDPTTPRNVTAARMIQSGPEGSYYGAYRTRLAYRNGAPHSWNSNTAEHVGTVFVPRGEQRPPYLAIAQQFATPEFPAFAWPDRLPC